MKDKGFEQEAEGWESVSALEREVERLRRLLARRDAKIRKLRRELAKKESQLNECLQARAETDETIRRALPGMVFGSRGGGFTRR